MMFRVYIKKHDKTLIFRSIQYKFMLQKQDSNEATNLISLENEEESIAANFFDYINNEQLVALPVPVLYRIINNPKMIINELNQTNKNQLIDFLFKCLKKHERKASVLFSNLDLENQRIDIFSKLNDEFSDIFDFSMINSKFLLKTTTDLLSEMSKLKELKSEKQKQQDLVESFKQFAQEQLNKEHEKLSQSIEKLKKEVEDEEIKLRKVAARNIIEMKELINKNSSQISSFITKDILNKYFNQIFF